MKAFETMSMISEAAPIPEASRVYHRATSLIAELPAAADQEDGSVAQPSPSRRHAMGTPQKQVQQSFPGVDREAKRKYAMPIA